MGRPGRKGSTAARPNVVSQVPVKRATGKSESEDIFGQRRKWPKMFPADLDGRESAGDQQTIPYVSPTIRQNRLACFHDWVGIRMPQILNRQEPNRSSSRFRRFERFFDVPAGQVLLPATTDSEKSM